MAILRQLIETPTWSSKNLLLTVILLLRLRSILVVVVHALPQLASVVLGVVRSHHLRDIAAGRVGVLG